MTEVDAKSSLVLNVWTSYGRLFVSAIASWTSQCPIRCLSPISGFLYGIPLPGWWSFFSCDELIFPWHCNHSSGKVCRAVPCLWLLLYLTQTRAYPDHSPVLLSLYLWMELRMMSPRISLLALLCHLQHNQRPYRMWLFATSGGNKRVIRDWLACPWFAVYWGVLQWHWTCSLSAVMRAPCCVPLNPAMFHCVVLCRAAQGGVC